jgi:hypothetical protein
MPRLGDCEKATEKSIRAGTHLCEIIDKKAKDHDPSLLF